MNRYFQCLMVAGLVLASTGCAITESEPWFKATHFIRPRSNDDPFEPNDGVDEWAFVGEEGRGDRDRERDPDRWWFNHIMSEEARNIERNLGIE